MRILCGVPGDAYPTPTREFRAAMCLGIPGEVVEVEDGAESEFLVHGTVAFGGARKRVCLAYVPEAQVGDYVIVHAGFALSRVDPEEAEKVFDLLEQIEQGAPAAAGPGHEIPG